MKKFLFCWVLFVIIYPSHAQNDSTQLALLDSLFEKGLHQQAIEKALSLEKRWQTEGSKRIYIQVIMSLNDNYTELGDYKKAKKYTKKNDLIRQKYISPSDTLHLKSLSSSIYTYIITGEYEKSQELYHYAFQTLDTVSIGKTSLYANLLVGAADLSMMLSDYPAALRYIRQAKYILDTQQQQDSYLYASMLGTMAGYYEQNGVYHTALTLCEQLLPILEKHIGKDAIDYRISLENYALLLDKIGQYTRAITIYENDVLPFYAQRLGEEHYEYALSLNNLALMYMNIEENQKAAKLLEKAEQKLKKAVGENHIAYTSCIGNLATAYDDLKEDQKALTLYTKSTQLVEKQLGKGHIDYALSLTNLADFYFHRNNFEQALTYQLEAITIFSKNVSPQNDYYLALLGNIAASYGVLDKVEEEEKYLNELMRLHLEKIKLLFPMLAEEEKEAFLATSATDFKHYRSFVVRNYEQYPHLKTTLFEQNLLTKGLVFQSLKKLRENITESKNKELIDAFEKWKTNRNQLNLAWQLSEEEQKEQKLNLKQLKEQVQQAETFLNRLAREKELSSIKNLDFFTKSYTFQATQQKLHTNEAIVEILRIEQYDKTLQRSCLRMFFSSSGKNQNKC